MVFEGVRPVLHTPFADAPGEAILWDELAHLVERMIAAGVDGVVALGLASEAWAITEAERARVIETVAAACTTRVPFLVGLDGTTAVATERARLAARLGAAGLMVVPPRQATTRDAVVQHLAAIADASGSPVLVQDSPQVSGVTLEVDTLIAAAEAQPLVCAVKSEIPGAGAKASAIRAAGLELVAGWGGLHYLEQVTRGAVGCMPGCDLGPAIVAIDRAVRSGDRNGAEALYRRILPFLSLATASLDLLLLTAKRHLRREGIFSTELLRQPARRLDEQEARTVDALLDELAAAGTPGFGSA